MFSSCVISINKYTDYIWCCNWKTNAVSCYCIPYVHRHSTPIMSCLVLSGGGVQQNMKAAFFISVLRVMHSGQPSTPSTLLCSQTKSGLFAWSYSLLCAVKESPLCNMLLTVCLYLWFVCACVWTDCGCDVKPLKFASMCMCVCSKNGFLTVCSKTRQLGCKKALDLKLQNSK